VNWIHSLDITPTLLYAMGLPVAQDFDGRPQTALFQGNFRRRFPVKTIPSWGTRQTGDAITSEADAELMEELRALGYLD
jgi:arylsulfatase A-like enzyme